MNLNFVIENGHNEQRLYRQTTVPEVNGFHNIPEDLKNRPQWVVWKDDKKPYDPKSGEPAKVNDATSWSSFEQAVQASAQYEGIGFVFTLDDPYAGIDFDHCLSNGAIESPFVRNWVDRLDSYTEVSASGTGLHVIVEGTLGESQKQDGVETYDERRYFTFTGDVFENRSTIEDRSREILQLQAAVRECDAIPKSPRIHSDLSIDQRLSAAFRAKNGDAIKRLFEGETSEHNDDESAADLALCNYLAFYSDGDAQILEEMFSQSTRAQRAKWDRADYRNRTIKEALKGTTEFYDSSFTIAAAQHEAPLGYSLGELRTKQIEPTVPLVLSTPKDTLCLLQAVGGHGKSTFIRNVAVHMAGGLPLEPFYSGGTPLPVVYANWEHDHPRDDLTRLIASLKLTPQQQSVVDKNLYVIHRPKFNKEVNLKLSLPEHMKKLKDYCIPRQAHTVFIDTIRSSFAPRNENDSSEMGQIGDSLVSLAESCNAVVCAVHHIGKAKAEEGKSRDPYHRGRGASSFPDAATTVWNLDRTSENGSDWALRLECTKDKLGLSPIVYNANLNRQTRIVSVLGPESSAGSLEERVKEILSHGPLGTKELAERLGKGKSWGYHHFPKLNKVIVKRNSKWELVC